MKDYILFASLVTAAATAALFGQDYILNMR